MLTLHLLSILFIGIVLAGSVAGWLSSR